MTNPLRSVLITPNVCGADGISSLSRQIVRALPEPLVVLSLHDADGMQVGATMVRGAGGSRSRLLTLAARLTAQCDRDTIAICAHVHLAPVTRLVAWRAATVVYVLCGVEAWVGLRPAERWALESGELIAISQHTEARFKAANPRFGDTPVSVVYPGLPPAVSSASTTTSRPMALIVGRMATDEVYKGHDVLIDIWPRVLERHARVELCVVGDGTDRVRLEAKAARAGLTGSVTFTGRVDHHTLERLYRECIFFVMPSRDEGFGLVFLEAMDSGKACIGGQGAAAEIIQNEVTGLIVDPCDGDEVAAAVLRLLDEPATCRAMGSAGRARYLSTFTDEHFQRRFVQALHREVVA